jgi:hypothetical protein
VTPQENKATKRSSETRQRTLWCGNQVHLPQSALHKSPVLLYVLWKNVNAAVKFASNMNSFRSSSTSRKTNRLAENPLGRTGKTRNETAR